MPRLRQAVIVVVAEFGVGRVTSGTLEALFWGPRGCGFPAAGALAVVVLRGRLLRRRIIFR